MLRRLRFGGFGFALLLVATTDAGAGPGTDAFAEDGIEILDEAAGRACAPAGRVCVYPVSDSTRLVEEHEEGTVRKPGPTLARTSIHGSRSSDLPWTFELAASFAKPALAGNVVFLIFDADDPESIARSEVVTLRQAPIRGGHALTARFSLSPNDGVRERHGYLIRVVQLIRGRQVLLAAGNVHLQ